jgi:hypothetical protein
MEAMMIRLQPRTFRRAFEKAQSINPRAIKHGAHYFIERSGSGFAHVVFTLRHGAIWVTCDCPAGLGRNRSNIPAPCYHAAAAYLAERIAKLTSATVTRPADVAPDSHTHHCPRCGDLYECGCQDWMIDDLSCETCDAVDLERISADSYFYAA